MEQKYEEWMVVGEGAHKCKTWEANEEDENEFYLS